MFRNLQTNDSARRELKDFLLSNVDRLVCHNLIEFDLGVLEYFKVLSKEERLKSNISVIDTLILSRLLNYRQPGGHSLDRWGEYFKYPKSKFSDYSKWSQELEDRCITDTKINFLLFKLFERFVNSPEWGPSISLEHETAFLCLELRQNGFPFDVGRATELLGELRGRVGSLEAKFASVFPPKAILIKEITPKLTQKGTLHAKDFRWLSGGDLTAYSAESPFSLFEWVPFNPRSPKQRIEVLNAAGWKPTNKTKGHLEAERDRNTEALKHFKVYGWKCDDENLSTLPENAPEDAKLLSEFLLYSSRLEDLEEWLNLYNSKDGCIHGTFSGIGSWTHRKSHQRPNMANIPALVSRKGTKQPYGYEFRSCWTSREGHVLVGCDAEGIQLRVFAHYCNDQKLISGIVSGKKEEKTDIHSINMGILNYGINDPDSWLCKSRESAKTYIYALFLGAAGRKQSEILQCTVKQAAEGLERILEFYPGWKALKAERLPADAAKGYFVGLDGRLVMFPSAHHILAGYLQNGESVIMKKACTLWHEELRTRSIPFTFRNDVHDEWQTETLPEYANLVGEIQSQSIVTAGKHFKLNCPLAGKAVTGTNWAITH